MLNITYQAEFEYTKDGEELTITRTLPNGEQDTSPVNLEEINHLKKLSQDFKWNQSPDLSQQIGERLFNILNGDRQTLMRALKEASDHGKNLQVILRVEGPVSNLPFELLYYGDFLILSRMHLIRRVSDWGISRKPESGNRPLRILFMVCSPQDIYPQLEFEREEETIFEITKDLPVEIDVEDTGSLEGLGEWLTTNKYDVIHITGHADIDKNGKPFFWMENEEGLSVPVTPSELWEKLALNLPRLVFLSGCRTGEIPEHVAAMSFAHHLVAGHISTVLSWGLPVSDAGARCAAEKLYFELSRGENILDAVFRTRYELFKHYPTDWSLLRLFSDGTPLDVPLVQRGQEKRPKLRELQYIYLENSQVKVLKKGFIGRRRQIQQGLRCLRKDNRKVGLLLYGTGGLGKSCLAGKFCERFKDHTLIIVHGKLSAVTFHEALKDGFIRADDNRGLRILEQPEEMPEKIRRLCSRAFTERDYLILLDDFEKNLEGIEKGQTEICAEAVPILEALLRFLPYSAKVTQLIITTRYTFSLTFSGVDLVKERLETIGLTSFIGADKRKKISELKNIIEIPDEETRDKLVELGRGNPRLMDDLNTLVGMKIDLDVTSLLSEAMGKQEEFVQELVLRQIMGTQPEEFQTFLRRSAVYRLPVIKEGIKLLCEDLKNWEVHIEKAVQLSLMEGDKARQDFVWYWVTPLLRENIFGELEEKERRKCHQGASSYYQKLLSTSRYDPVSSAELIEHALEAELDDIAIEEAGGRFLPYLRHSLAYKEALAQGEHVLSYISQPKRNAQFAKFIFELGWIHCDMGKAEQAISYYEQALSIVKDVYGEKHPYVATTLNNIGSAWHDLGEHKKAIEYYEQALSIDKEVYGDRHPSVATDLNNIGLAWHDLGEPKKAIEYYEQALSIDKEVYGDRHPSVATRLNNIGLAWHDLGEHKKAIEYYEQALSIVKDIYGEKHPYVATTLSNIGSVWDGLGDSLRAQEYFRKAYKIFRECYGEEHPHARIVKEWLDSLKK